MRQMSFCNWSSDMTQKTRIEAGAKIVFNWIFLNILIWFWLRVGFTHWNREHASLEMYSTVTLHK